MGFRVFPLTDMQPSTRILLASGSPYRKQLLTKVIDHFENAAPNLDESPRINETPENLAPRLAKEKAEAMTADFPEHWIIGSDQVAVRGSTCLGKPGSHAEAYRQLTAISGQCVTFFTSVCLISPGAGKIQTETDVCRVYFREFAEDQINRYLLRERPYDCAASFKAEGLGIALVKKIEGDDPNALVGLPLILLTQIMADAGLSVV